MHKLMLSELEHCFKYFYENFSREENSYGMMPDAIPEKRSECSVAANGFMLAAMVIGVDYNFVTRAEAETICLRTLDTMARLKHREGMLYHFYDIKTLARSRCCEASTIDTALYLAGALTAGAYFGGEVLNKAREQLDRCNFRHFYSHEKRWFYMSEYDDGFSGHWDWYSEQLLLYFLAAASGNFDEYALEAYESFTRVKDSYNGGKEYIYGWFGSLFIHQYSHAFIDFRGYVDGDGVNWFDNSVIATLENRRYCMENAYNYKTYGKNAWGLTSCLTPSGYKGAIGVAPSGNGHTENMSNGTVAPCGALGSVVFTPKESLAALKHFAKIPQINKEYGLTDAYNKDANWYADAYISIDKGITLLMLANYDREIVWRNFCSLPEIQRAYKILEFKKENV